MRIRRWPMVIGTTVLFGAAAVACDSTSSSEPFVSTSGAPTELNELEETDSSEEADTGESSELSAEEGGEVAAEEGGEAAAEEGGEAAAEEGGEAAAEEGGEAAAEEGGEATAEEGGEAAAEEGGEATAEEGGEAATEEGGEAAAEEEESGEATAEEGGEAATEEGGEAAAEEGGEAAAEEGGEAAAEEGGEVAAEEGGEAGEEGGEEELPQIGDKCDGDPFGGEAGVCAGDPPEPVLICSGGVYEDAANFNDLCFCEDMDGDGKADEVVCLSQDLWELSARAGSGSLPDGYAACRRAPSLLRREGLFEGPLPMRPTASPLSTRSCPQHSRKNNQPLVAPPLLAS